jgi:hypothetical protein
MVFINAFTERFFMLKRILIAALLLFGQSCLLHAMKKEKRDAPASWTPNKAIPKRARNTYDPSSLEPYKISRSKLSLFLKCPRCFYRSCRIGIKPPEGFPLTLNNAVDTLLKREFDYYRSQGRPHPLFARDPNLADVVPFSHELLETWRDALHAGVQYCVPGTNIMITGGVDDIWINMATGELIVADYKATSKLGRVSLDADWQDEYKKQVEIYQWLLRKNGFRVSDTAYFVYCNADQTAPQFNQRLNFDITLIAYTGSTTWIDNIVMAAYNCLQCDYMPAENNTCGHCRYLASIKSIYTPMVDAEMQTDDQ